MSYTHLYGTGEYIRPDDTCASYSFNLVCTYVCTCFIATHCSIIVIAPELE